MAATSLEQFGEVFAAAYRTRDAEAVADMYDDDAIFVMSDFGYAPTIGRAAIVERMSEIFAVTNDIESISDEPVMVVEAGDYVIVHQTSTTRSTLVDGTQHESKARATYVLHRGIDSNWRVVIDHASSL